MSDRRASLHRCTCALAIDSSRGSAYNEEAFGYLLLVQRRRSERSDRPFLLLLIDLKGKPDPATPIEKSMARPLFAALSHALREDDLIGWYREPYIAGALLTECHDGTRGATAETIVQRVTKAIGAALAPEAAARLQVRICHIQPKLTS